MITFADVVRVCPEANRIGCTMMDRDNALKHGQRLAERLSPTQTTPEITAALAAWWLFTEFRQPVPKALMDTTNGLIKPVSCIAIEAIEQTIAYENKLAEIAVVREKAAHTLGLQNRVEELVVALESAQTTHAELKASVEGFEIEYNELRSRLAQANDDLAVEKAAHTGTKTRLQTMEQRHSELQTQVEQLSGQLAVEKASVARLTGELEEATKPTEPKPKNKNKQPDKSDE